MLRVSVTGGALRNEIPTMPSCFRHDEHIEMLTRRRLLQLGGSGTYALSLGGLLQAQAATHRRLCDRLNIVARS